MRHVDSDAACTSQPNKTPLSKMAYHDSNTRGRSNGLHFEIGSQEILVILGDGSNNIDHLQTHPLK